MAFDYCNEAFGEHELIACGNWKKSGFDAIAFLEQDNSITDYTSPTEWNAAIAAGEAVIVKQIKGELPAAAKLEGENPIGGGVESIADGIDWTFNATDSNTTDNNDGFWETMNKRQVYVVLHNPRENEIYVAEQNATIFAVQNIPGGSGREYQNYTIEVKWESDVDQLLQRYDAPAGIFEA